MSLVYHEETVSEVKVKYFDTLPPCSSICVLKTGFLFAAAEFGNHSLYQFSVSACLPAPLIAIDWSGPFPFSVSLAVPSAVRGVSYCSLFYTRILYYAAVDAHEIKTPDRIDVVFAILIGCGVRSFDRNC